MKNKYLQMNISKKKKQLLNIKQRKKRKHHLHLQSAQLI